MPDIHSREILLELMKACASDFFSKCTNDQIKALKALCMTNTEARCLALTFSDISFSITEGSSNCID